MSVRKPVALGVWDSLIGKLLKINTRWQILSAYLQSCVLQVLQIGPGFWFSADTSWLARKWNICFPVWKAKWWRRIFRKKTYLLRKISLSPSPKNSVPSHCILHFGIYHTQATGWTSLWKTLKPHTVSIKGPLFPLSHWFGLIYNSFLVQWRPGPAQRLSDLPIFLEG